MCSRSGSCSLFEVDWEQYTRAPFPIYHNIGKVCARKECSVALHDHGLELHLDVLPAAGLGKLQHELF